ncbi:PREDICTED: C-type lectin domain family 4 member F-like, partial [Gekko japonicus]|uniref:C-type lectin domain family 4 member F-like n=1 Tax=Gekko japonicus TaxID=146911 RepID=A0ABM1JZS7_GEKJA
FLCCFSIQAMAPKGKPDPKAKPAAKAPAKAPKAPVPPGTLTIKQILIYVLCMAVAILSILTILVMTIVYFTLQEVGGPMDYSLKRLRSSLSYTFNNTEFSTEAAMKVADTVDDLEERVKEADDDYTAKKKTYKNSFEKAAKSSVPWKVHGESLYYFAREQKTWYDAERFCISRDSHLASVLNDEEQDFITSQIQQASWIGLMDENRDGAWGWTDGSGLQKE